MIREHGDMWSVFKKSDYFIFTANSYVRMDGNLVMGRGLAYQVQKRFPEVAIRLGMEIEHLQKYALIFCRTDIHDYPEIGAFQVKRHYMDDADLALIELSTQGLRVLANELPNKQFDMNYPGIGYGRLKREEVAPIINTLPDNVHIWTY